MEADDLSLFCIEPNRAARSALAIVRDGRRSPPALRRTASRNNAPWFGLFRKDAMLQALIALLWLPKARY